MTDAGNQFAVICALSAVGAAAGCLLAVVRFVETSLGLRAITRFLSEFVVTTGCGALLWLVVLRMCAGEIRLFFVFPTAVFGTVLFICISKVLIPLVPRAKEAAKRFSDSHKDGFIARYILK